MIKCVCSVCKYEWFYPKGTDKDIVMATCAPCGHQGLFKFMDTGRVAQFKSFFSTTWLAWKVLGKFEGNIFKRTHIRIRQSIKSGASAYKARQL